MTSPQLVWTSLVGPSFFALAWPNLKPIVTYTHEGDHLTREGS